MTPHLCIPPALRRASGLKVILVLLILAITSLVILAAGAALGHPNIIPGITFQKVTDLPFFQQIRADIAAQKQEENHLVRPEVWRDWDEPEYSLLSGRQPHEIGCDIPLGKGEGMLLFIGVFSSAHDGKHRRELFRKYVLPDFPSEVTIKFILGRGRPVNSGWMPGKPTALEAEQERYGDMIFLDIEENMDDGKTHTYFKWVAQTYGGEAMVEGRPRFVMKADDDTFLVMPNIITQFKSLNCSKNVYWGTTTGSYTPLGLYHRGLGYALSWPLASWIGNAVMPDNHAARTEDARTGQWMRSLDPSTDPLEVVDLGWSMGDWNQLHYTTATVALHWLKKDWWVVDEREKILQVWKDAGRAYTPDMGVSLEESIAAGRMTPEEARLAWAS